MIKLRRMRWRGCHMGMVTNALGPPPRNRREETSLKTFRLWKHYVKMDLKARKWGWINMAQDRYQWWTVVKMIMNLWVSWKAVSFLSSWLMFSANFVLCVRVCCCCPPPPSFIHFHLHSYWGFVKGHYFVWQVTSLFTESFLTWQHAALC
jgi:hypothetical protein